MQMVISITGSGRARLSDQVLRALCRRGGEPVQGVWVGAELGCGLLTRSRPSACAFSSRRSSSDSCAMVAYRTEHGRVVNRSTVHGLAQLIRQGHDLRCFEAMHGLELPGQRPVGQLVHQPASCLRVSAEFVSRRETS
jgi:hypothetical protein